jgi:hypothetical protein
MGARPGLFASGMLDIARAIVLLAAIVQAIRYRFLLGIVFGIVMVGGFTVLAVAAYFALSNHAISGEYGFAFVYVGPSMLPFGERDWLPTVCRASSLRFRQCPS